MGECAFQDKKTAKVREAPSPRGFILISCSNASNSGVEETSPRAISRPPQSFLMVTIPGFLLRPYRIFFIVEGGMAEIAANLRMDISRSPQSAKRRLATAIPVSTSPHPFLTLSVSKKIVKSGLHTARRRNRYERLWNRGQEINPRKFKRKLIGFLGPKREKELCGIFRRLPARLGPRLIWAAVFFCIWRWADGRPGAPCGEKNTGPPCRPTEMMIKFLRKRGEVLCIIISFLIWTAR